ncbi:MAG: type IX secretion system sortase PorU [Candidatus Delongbacteria bacterium]|nr:type IX secretion system sortase PorU [Candidatus Delongbacteria bacterium]
MRKTTLQLIATLMIALFLQVQNGQADWYDDVEIISSNEQELVFTWRPESRIMTEADTTRLYPRRGVRQMSDGSWLRLFHLLLPAHALPGITLLDLQTIPPQVDSLFVPNHDWIATPRLLQAGEHSLLELALYPTRSQAGGIEQLQAVTVRIKFPPASRLGGIKRAEIDWLQNYTLNPEYAGRWLTRRLPAPLPRTVALTGDQFYRFPVSQTGIYQLTRATLSELTNVDDLLMHNIHVYGNDGRQLPEAINDIQDAVLHDLPLIYDDDGDELFETGESISFLACGTAGWVWNGATINHYSNLYTDLNYCWLVLDGFGPAPVMEELPSATGQTLEKAEFRYFQEEAQYILRASPYYSLDDDLSGHSERTYSWPTPALAQADTLGLIVRLYHDDDYSAWMTLELAGDTLDHFYCTDTLRRTVEWPGSFPAGEASFQLISSPVTPMTIPHSYFDFFEVYYPARLEFFADQVFYATSESQGEQDYAFVPQADKLILDITEPLQPRFTRGDQFKLSHSGAPRFILGATAAAYQPVTDLVPYIDQDQRMNLPAADFIVIAPEVYRNYLTPFVEHKQSRGFATQLVSVDEIMNSCSGGRMDPVAIRDFLYDQYLRHGMQLKYVLLVGNGHYDYRNLSGSAYPVTMPMYYHRHELYGHPYPRDDYYVRYSDLIDVTVSRWQCYTATDVQVQVDKVLQLETAVSTDNWRNRAVLVADDERRERGDVRDSEHRHTHNAENLITDYFPPEFEIKRVYSAAYPGEFNSANGLFEKPACEAALVNSINAGAWIINFQGHGNNQVWTDERIFTPAHGSLLHNEYRLPVFVAATCNWAELDQTHGEAFSVQLMNKPDGGAVGIIAATNLTSGTTNPDFTDAFYSCVMSDYHAGTFSTPALCLRQAKNMDITDGNRLLYLSQGDPTHGWDYPEFGTSVGEILDVNGVDSDTLLTLGVYHAQGQTVSRADSILQLFSGEAQLQVFDANRASVLNLQWVNTPDSVIIHEDGNLLFRGRYSIDQGAFSGGFIVPRDISQSSEPASMRFFYSAGDTIYGNGYRSDFYLATTDIDNSDETGPETDIRLNSTAWHPGDAVGRSFVLILLAEDESGINLTGEIGHKIELTLDDRQPLDVTQDFSYDLDSWQSGRVEYLVNFLEVGTHTVRARIWDNLNNATIVVQDFRVVDTSRQRLTEVVNYPNPFSDATSFTFLVDGLLAEVPLDVTVRVFTLAGRNVWRGEFPALQPEGGFLFTPTWNGRNSHGEQLANGVYFYQVAVALPPFSYNIMNEFGQLESINSDPVRLTAISKLIIGR